MNIERKHDTFDQIKDSLDTIQDCFRTLTNADSTAKQRRAITRASEELTLYEQVVVEKLKKTMGIS